jgi:hypothetical protein
MAVRLAAGASGAAGLSGPDLIDRVPPGDIRWTRSPQHTWVLEGRRNLGAWGPAGPHTASRPSGSLKATHSPGRMGP